MLSPLKNATYARLFGAQIAALLGTGLATVALGLLAHELAGASAGEILGAIFAIKMIAYVAVAPIASALATHAPRKTLLIALDLVRAAIGISLPFVSEPWQIYALMAVLYVASAAFTPAFQAMIPDVLTDEREYTKALSLSRLAADLESVASPVLAALLLAVMSFHQLFAGTAVGFVFSALLVLLAVLPAARKAVPKPFFRRLTSGVNLFMHTPRLRGLVALSLATAAGGAMVFVNTVVIVQSNFAMSQQATAWALAAFGLGSMGAALTLPPLLDRIADRTVVISGALALALGLSLGPFVATTYPGLLALWVVLGCSYSLTLTPVGRVLRRSAHAEDRPALFAAQFALSHACWLIAYPLAGYVSASAGASAAFWSLAMLCGVGAIVTAAIWPAREDVSVEHSHDDLTADHPHMAPTTSTHSHEYIIDDLHRRWPH
ncbi:probable NreB protein [alpha proteobacterium U9-1i]|nr:probable NreB protein [alpha proteobacterium U9-1i]